MPTLRSAPRFLALLAALAVTPSPAAQGLPPKVHRLNGPLARRTMRDVTAFQLSADGTRAFYLADPESDDAFQLFSVPADGSAPAVACTPLFTNPRRPIPDFQAAADGARVVFRLGTGSSPIRLHSASADGTGFVNLDRANFFGASVEAGYRLTGGGTRVVFLADIALDGVQELWSVPSDGSAAPVRINAPLPAGGDVLDFEPAPDGTRVVYRADQLADEVFELFTAPSDAGAPPVRLNLPPVTGGDVVAGYRIDPTGTRVVYVADQDQNNTFYVHSVRLDASLPAVRLNPTNTSQNLEPEFVLTGDGARVVYRWPLLRPFELWGVPIDGSSAPRRLTSGLPEPGVLSGFRAGPAGDVLYRASSSAGGTAHLFAVPADGSRAPARLDALDDTGAEVLDDFRIASGGARALFRTRSDADPRLRLFSAPLDGATAALEIASPADTGDVLALEERAGRVTLLVDGELDELFELHQAPADGSGPVERLGDALAPFADAQPDFQLAPGGRTALFRADARRDDAFDLLRSDPAELTLALNPPFPASTDQVSSVGLFKIAGERVVYTAAERAFNVRELHSAPLHGGGTSLTLNGPLVPGGQVEDFQLSPDLRHVVYVADQELDERFDVYAVPLDGSAPAQRKSGDFVAGGDVRQSSLEAVLLSSDGRWIVYLADQRVDQQLELFSAPLVEDGPAVLLTPLRSGRDVERFQLTPDGRWGVYNADADIDERFEVYAVRTDGSAPPVRIGPMQNAGGDCGVFRVAADSLRVVYIADSWLNDQIELFVTRVDGLVPPRRLSAPLTTHGDLRGYDIGSDLERVLYLADQDVPGVEQVFSVPLEGSSALALELSPPLTADTKVREARLTTDGKRALWTDRLHQLWSAPADGSSPAVLLHGGFPEMIGVFGFSSSPDSRRAVYLSDPALLQRWELFSVPVTGGVAPVRLHPPLTRLRRVSTFTYGPAGTKLAYLANQESDTEVELYLTAIDGSAAPRKLNAPLVANGGVNRFEFGASESEGVYVADQEVDGVFELWSTVLPDPSAKRRAR